MSLTERLFGRPAGAKLDLAAVQARLADAVRRAGDADPELTRARLADGCRDAAVTPALPEEFDAAAKGLDGEGWRRLAALAGTLDLTPVRAALPQLPAGRSGAEAVAAFVGVARGTPLLTIEVLGLRAGCPGRAQARSPCSRAGPPPREVTRDQLTQPEGEPR